MSDEQSAVIDCAGASIGGAARFLREMDAWIAANEPQVTVIGRKRSLTASWLLERELKASRHLSRISLNNVSMVRPGGQRTVLLRNALHFASSTEMAGLSFAPSRSFRTQIPVVRATARISDRVVVPCSAMAERVLRHVPDLRDRLEVRFHPLAPRPWAQERRADRTVLVPIINSPYKRLEWHLSNVVNACRGTAVSEVAVTAYPTDVSQELASNPLLNFIGELSSEDLDSHFSRSAALYFPTQLESFGYPLAEARANGRRVVAIDSEQNREIAGPALVGFSLGNEESLRDALDEAVLSATAPDPGPFDPDAYFAWLVSQ